MFYSLSFTLPLLVQICPLEPCVGPCCCLLARFGIFVFVVVLLFCFSGEWCRILSVGWSQSPRLDQAWHLLSVRKYTALKGWATVPSFQARSHSPGGILWQSYCVWLTCKFHYNCPAQTWGTGTQVGCTEHLPSLDAQPGSSSGTIELRFDLSFSRHLRVAKNICLSPAWNTLL